MKPSEITGGIILDKDAEVDAASFLANRVAEKEVAIAEPENVIEDGLSEEVAQAIRVRLGEIVIAKPFGSFEKPHVQLDPLEAKLVLAAAYNYRYAETADLKPPAVYVVNGINDLADEGNKYFFPSTSVVIE